MKSQEIDNTEEILAKSEVRYRDLFDNISSGVAIFEPRSHGEDFAFKDCNKVGERILGLRKKSLIGKTLQEIQSGLERFGLLEVLKRVWQSGKPERFPVELGEAEETAWYECFVYGLPSGEVVAVFDDVTQRKRAERVLKESEARFRTIFNAAADAIFIYDMEGALIEVNNWACLRLGYTRSELLSMRANDIEFSGFTVQPPPSIAEIIEKGSVLFETTHVTKDKQHISTEVNSRLVNYAGIPAILSIARDITDRKRLEETREAINALLLICNASTSRRELMRDLMTFFKKLTGCDAVAVRLKEGDDFPYYECRGFSEDFLREESFLFARGIDGDLLRDDQGRPKIACMCGNLLCGRFDPSMPFFSSRGSFWTGCTSELLAENGAVNEMSLMRMRCNHEGYESIMLTPVRLRGEVLGLFQFNAKAKGVFTEEKVSLLEDLVDYTAFSLRRIEAEDAANRLVTAVDQTSEGVLVTDKEGRIQYANPAFSKISGYDCKEILGLNPRFLQSGRQDKTFYEQMWNTLLSGNVWTGRLFNKRKNGKMYEEECSISPVYDASGVVVNYVAITRNVTRERELEHQLRHSQKMEAVGTLAGGIAHDFNNILQSILGYAELARNAVKEEGQLSLSIREILTAGRRASNLVSQILTFSRKSDQEHGPMKLQSVLKEALELLRGTIPSTIEIQTRIDERCRPVMGNPTAFHQVIMNLCTNAYHAVKEEVGLLNVELSETRVNEVFSALHPDLPTGTYARLSVTDSGCGIDDETLKRIFEPYFTTKKQSEGTGLGLSVVHGIVKEAGGSIIVKTAVGKGSRFDVFIPISLDSLPPSEASSKEDPSDFRGTERVLLVDDEEAITRLMGRILLHYGYKAEICSNGVDALELFKSDPKRFDVVITDQTMPNMTGLRLADEILFLRPDIPIILCTGYSNLVDAKGARTSGIREYIAKPLMPKALLAAIRRVVVKRVEGVA